MIRFPQEIGVVDLQMEYLNYQEKKVVEENVPISICVLVECRINGSCMYLIFLQLLGLIDGSPWKQNAHHLGQSKHQMMESLG